MHHVHERGIGHTHTHTHTHTHILTGSHAEVSPARILLLVDYNLGRRFQTQRAYQVTDT